MIRTRRAHLKIAALTHPGMAGKNNEDRYATSAFRLSRSNSTPSVLAVLCDGIGGHQAGEVAAEIAVEAITQQIADSNGSQPLQDLENAIIQASQQVHDYAASQGTLQGMGSTCACAWVIGDRLYTGAVGDSRIYLMRGKTLHQLTTDHTWIQEALEKGLLKPEQARGHPNAHVIRRFVGSPTPPEVDLRLRLEPDEPDEQAIANQGMRLLRGDRLLLCSDGLTDMVSKDEILHGLGNRDLQGGVESLVDLACRRGGHDNITAVALEAPRRAPFGAPSGAGRPALNRALAGVGCFLLVLLAVAGGYLLYQLGGLASLVRDLRLLNASVTPGPTAILSPTGPGGFQYPTLLTPPASLTPLPTTTPTRAPTARTPTPSNRATVTPALPDQPYPGPGPVIDATLQPDFSQPGPFGSPGPFETPGTLGTPGTPGTASP